MGDSLRDQLRKAGLVTDKQAARAKQELERQQYRQKKSGRAVQADQAAARRQQAEKHQSAKAARDRQLNQTRQEKAAARARAAEIRQLIEQHRLPVLEGEQLEYFNFVAGRKIRRVAVDAERRERLRKGELSIVWFEGRTAVLPAAIAERVEERDQRAVIPFQEAPEQVDEDDPYKDFVVPDDLRW
jgi:hypothetical protein